MAEKNPKPTERPAKKVWDPPVAPVEINDRNEQRQRDLWAARDCGRD